ncbi:MAG TPA: GTP cyclohydrolase I FolE2 [Desulfobulbaceae bacterium]|nr:GTP cyclohydrolase I FolE2 [Desulfobulbaceae bacterium]
MHIEEVGVRNIQLPVKIKEKGGQSQHTIASISMQASLPDSRKDGCIDAFIAILNRSVEAFSVRRFREILIQVREELHSQSAGMEMTFPYFIEKTAPVSGTGSLMEYSCTFAGTVGERDEMIITVRVPVTTLCPCSKEISDHGAHNQRAEVVLNVKTDRRVWIEDLIGLVERSASCELYALLKRPDEKFVTEKAYNNPMFVEDVVRKVAVAALAHPDIRWFSAGVESFESIHKHSAYAFVDSDDMRGISRAA